MKVVLIDDHPLVLQGLTSVLESEEDFEVIGQLDNIEIAIKLLPEKQPDLVIVDLRLGKENGLDIIEQVKDLLNNCRFVVLTSSSNIHDFQRANELSVDGYLSKEALPEEFLSAIRMVQKGRKYYDPLLVEAFMNYTHNDPLKELTSRERDVLFCLKNGLSNKEIGEQLFITEYTVKKHVSQILDKLALADRTQAALFAVQLDNGEQKDQQLF